MDEIKPGDLVTLKAYEQERPTAFVVLKVETVDGETLAYVAFERFGNISQERVPVIALKRVEGG